ncbi:hypothetical protein H78_03892 [Pseudomonas protegens]|uniref:hypothetical protein n=1 Tax=Pseudomonas protegens TaxID=380021 RepID=UPI0009C3D226|nr:hypothetical protein [Pseudomonas protegens]AQT10553.1 hypothetical protein H78_03892 [Pseudomonas protegens]
MLDSVTGMTSRNADHLDLERFSSVAILLLQGNWMCCMQLSNGQWICPGSNGQASQKQHKSVVQKYECCTVQKSKP